MKLNATFAALAALLALGASALVFARGGTNEYGIISFGPGDNASQPAKEAPPAPAAPAPPPAEIARVEPPILAPIGTVVAWLKSYSNTPSLPPQWVECNGQTLSLPGSPYDGMAAPNLNGSDNQTKRFLRGSTQSGGVGGTEHHNHGFYVIGRATTRQVNVAGKEYGSNLPPYYEVTWIMRAL